jgi:CheY-like chemotaxis protein
MSDYLVAKGFRLTVARNGREAVDQTRELRPDLILMDIQMPGVNGMEATRQIREDSEFSSVPIIALTALAMPGDRERIIEAGANEYVAKPVSLRALVEMIATLLDRAAK